MTGGNAAAPQLDPKAAAELGARDVTGLDPRALAETQLSAPPSATAVHIAPAPTLPRSRQRLQEALLVPELAEVYLLLDNISAAAAKQIPDLTSDPVFAGEGKPWVQQICDIRWPPDLAMPGGGSSEATMPVYRAR